MKGNIARIFHTQINYVIFPFFYDWTGLAYKHM